MGLRRAPHRRRRRRGARAAAPAQARLGGQVRGARRLPGPRPRRARAAPRPRRRRRPPCPARVAPRRGGPERGAAQAARRGRRPQRRLAPGKPQYERFVQCSAPRARQAAAPRLPRDGRPQHPVDPPQRRSRAAEGTAHGQAGGSGEGDHLGAYGKGEPQDDRLRDP